MKTISGIVALVMLVAGCAAMQNTPAQDRAWAAYARCHPQYPQYVLTRVSADGRFGFTPVGSDAGAFVQCMTGNANWYAR
jgi:hypothetical protein